MGYKNGYVGDGSLVNNNNPNRQACPGCGSKNFKETISREKCNSCGYEVDYWGQGANDIANNTFDRLHREAEERREAQDKKYWEEEQSAYDRINSDWEEY